MLKRIITFILACSLGISSVNAMQQQQQVQTQRQQQKPKQTHNTAEHTHDGCACEHHTPAQETVPQEEQQQAPQEQDQQAQQEDTESQETEAIETDAPNHICKLIHAPCSYCRCSGCCFPCSRCPKNWICTLCALEALSEL